MEKGISVCMIVKDEADYLRQCLESIKDITDELIVVDTGSTDATVEIATEFGAKVLNFEWCEDFSAARNESLKHATREWTLVIDADELLLLSDIDEIKRLTNDPKYTSSKIIGFSFDQRSYSKVQTPKTNPNFAKDPKVSRYPYFVSNKLVRLFKNTPEIKYRYTIHELVEPSIRDSDGEIVETSMVMHHFGLLKPASFVSNKIKTYLDLVKRQLETDPENIRFIYLAGLASLEEQNEDDALKYFFSVAEKDPDYKLINSEIAKIYLARQEYTSAEEYFRKCSEIHPDNPSPVNNLAVTLMHQGKFHDALRLLEQNVEKFPQNVHLRRNLAVAQEKIKEKKGDMFIQ
jgi:glycosyltransferase involved in cell wall biosynthesis